VGTAIKLQNAIVVMMIAVYFLLRARDDTKIAPAHTSDAIPGPTPTMSSSSVGLAQRVVHLPPRLLGQARIRAVGIILITALAISATWTILQRVTETINPNKLLVNMQFVVSSISASQIASTFGVFVAPIPGAYIPASTQDVWTVDMVDLLSWLLVAGVVAGSFFLVRDRAIASLARATLLLAVLGGPIFVVLNFLSMSQYIPMPTRYGFTILPAMVICTAYAIRARWAGLCVLGAALLSVAFVAYRMA
jgi:hypothetical protein